MQKKGVQLQILVCLLVAGTLVCAGTANAKTDQIDISYKGLINRSIITHSGDTVGQVLEKLRANPDSASLKGLVQQYLEPFSYVCNDIVSYVRDTTGKPFVNITDYYPAGSPQPAWASLFREGHYQLYFNEDTVRIFLKGKDPRSLFASYHSVIRHPLQDIIHSFGNDYTIEVYAFRNDYRDNKIILDPDPYVTDVSKTDLGPRGTPLDIESFEEFFKKSVVPEAIEVDDSNHLFFYGQMDNDRTMAGGPLSLADFAAVYRGVFHYGDNPPYVSLDKHEDNRYAKVNYGGNLENTRVGSALLESDKLFKTLSTGLDPNSHEIIRSEISKFVSGFLTEDERSLTTGVKGHSMIRYWFYSDEIGTVTDGKIGAVENHRFLADVERMDVKIQVGPAQKDTIGHLNRNYEKYARTLRPFRELNSIGQMMALAGWLKDSGIKDRVDLDALLSVSIPGFETPAKTKKMLAVTAIAYGEDRPLVSDDIRASSKVFYLSEFLDNAPASVSDNALIDMGSGYIAGLEEKEMFPSVYISLKKQMEEMRREVKQAGNAMTGLEADIRKREESIGPSSPSREIEEYNSMIAGYNSLVHSYKSKVEELNKLVNLYNSQKISIYHISSVGGGIDLRPENMRGMRMAPDAKEVEMIRKVRSEAMSGEATSIPGGWVRSSLKNGKDSYFTIMKGGIWEKSQSINSNMVSYINDNNDKIWMRTNPASGNTEIKTVINNTTSEVHFDKKNKSFKSMKSSVPGVIQAQFTDKDSVVLLRTQEKDINAGQP